MAFDPTLPGFSKAVRLWCMAQITANLPSLNAALATDTLTPLPTLTASCVFRGDPTVLPDVNAAPLIFCVSGGGRLDGVDLEVVRQEYFGGIGYFQKIHTVIEAYIHPDALPQDDPTAQVASRDSLLDTVQDWLYAACFNTPAAVSPTLASRQFCTAPDYDLLDMAHIESFERSAFLKSFGGAQVLEGLLARHSGQLIGNL